MSSSIPYLLDYDRYYVMGRAEVNGLPVILQCSKGCPVHYCVQYAGNGTYFDTLAEAMLYMHNRWGFDIVGKPRAAWTEGPQRPLGEP